MISALVHLGSSTLLGAYNSHNKPMHGIFTDQSILGIFLVK